MYYSHTSFSVSPSFSLRSNSLPLSFFTPSPPSHAIRNASIHHTVLSSFLSMPKRFPVHQQRLSPLSQRNARYTSLVVRSIALSSLLATIIILFPLSLRRLHSRERWRQTLQHMHCVLPHWNHARQIQKGIHVATKKALDSVSGYELLV